jgi:hypothetical protein
MKKCLFIILVFAFQSAYSQNPPVTVLTYRWFELIEKQIIQADDPFSSRSGLPGTPPPPQRVVGVKTDKYFVYEVVVKNESNQNILGITLDYVFLASDGKAEKARKKFSFFHRRIKKNKKQTLIQKTKNPHDLVLDAKDYENETPGLREVVEINCVVFEDRTTWKRPEVDEKVCEDLRIKITREQRLKK